MRPNFDFTGHWFHELKIGGKKRVLFRKKDRETKHFLCHFFFYFLLNRTFLHPKLFSIGQIQNKEIISTVRLGKSLTGEIKDDKRRLEMIQLCALSQFFCKKFGLWQSCNWWTDPRYLVKCSNNMIRLTDLLSRVDPPISKRELGRKTIFLGLKIFCHYKI